MSAKRDMPFHVSFAEGSRFHFKMHWNAIIELVAFLGVAALLELTLLEPGTLASMRPHPFWVPVVLVSLQYGTTDGIAAVAASVLTQWLLGWPPRKAARNTSSTPRSRCTSLCSGWVPRLSLANFVSGRSARL